MATLKEIQNCQLEILKEVAKICDRNGIKYYLAYGTFLGAVRHKGFIPWDDDVDIYMFYDDAQRFMELCAQQLPTRYFAQTFDNDPGMGRIFIKVRDTLTYMPEEGQSCSHNQGIWIDVFFLLGAAKTEAAINGQMKMLFKFQKLCSERTNLKKMQGRNITKIYRGLKELFYCRPMSRSIYKRIGKTQDQHPHSYIPMGVSFYGKYNEDKVAYIKKVMVSQKLLDNCAEYEFENFQFNAFADYDSYLKQIYGEDYMIPQKYNAHIDDYSQVLIDKEKDNG